MLKRTIALAMVACLAGCGANDSGPGDEEEIAGVVRKLSSEGHQSEVCRTLFTQRLVRAIWGTQARCLRENADSDDDGRDSTRARDSQVHGDRATARVTTRVMGRKVAGEIELVREAGTWRVDELGLNFVRSLLSEAMQEGFIRSAERRGVGGSASCLPRVRSVAAWIATSPTCPRRVSVRPATPPSVASPQARR